MTEASTSTSDHPCRGIRRDGTRCQARPLPGSVWCFSHDPDRTAQRDAGRRKGGRNRSNQARLRGLVPPRLVAVYDRLEAALEEVHDGTLDPRAAGAMAAISRAMVSVLTAGELEARVRELEQQ